MASFLFAVNAVFPIILMVILGYILKKRGLMTPSLGAVLNKLVFRIFLPVMLFLNVYKITSPGDMDLGYIFYAVIAVAVVFLISLPLVLIVTDKNERRGPLLQSAFRSNFAHIGIPLAMSLFGDDGVATASLLSALLIPVFNVLAVISLSVFRERNEKLRIGDIGKSIVKNPLIQAVLLGVVLMLLRETLAVRGIDFDLTKIEIIAKPLGYLGNVATPLALIALGAQFEFAAVREMKKEILAGVAMRTVIVPVTAISVALALGIFKGEHFASFIAAFATPVAIASVPMAQEMGSDSALAGQLVVWTTLASGVTVFLFTFLLKVIGVF